MERVLLWVRLGATWEDAMDGRTGGVGEVDCDNSKMRKPRRAARKGRSGGWAVGWMSGWVDG